MRGCVAWWRCPYHAGMILPSFFPLSIMSSQETYHVLAAYIPSRHAPIQYITLKVTQQQNDIDICQVRDVFGDQHQGCPSWSFVPSATAEGKSEGYMHFYVVGSPLVHGPYWFEEGILVKGRRVRQGADLANAAFEDVVKEEVAEVLVALYQS